MRAQRTPAGLDKLAYQLALEHELTRLLALVALADYLAGRYRDSRVDHVLGRLRQPRPTEWVRLLVELGVGLGQRREPAFVTELPEWLADGRTVELFQASAETLERLVVEPEPASVLDAHRLLAAREESHQNLLAESGFLARYSICSVSGAEGAESGLTTATRWRGTHGHTEIIPARLGWIPAHERPFAVREGGRTALPLYPLMQLVELERATGLAGLALLNSFTPGATPRYGCLASQRHANLPVRDADGRNVDITESLASPEAWFQPIALSDIDAAYWGRPVTTPRAGTLRESLVVHACVSERYGPPVLLARDEDSGRDVAVRLLSHEPLAGSEDLLRLSARVSTLLQVHHPHMVEVLGLEPTANGDALLLLEEPTEAGTLEDVLREEPLLPSQALDIMDGLLSAIGTLHDVGFVHGHIHAANVSLSADGFAKLGGSVAPRALATGDASRHALQTIDGGNRTALSDQYMAGALLYKMLTGLDPAPGQPTPPSRLTSLVPPVLDTVVLRALAPAPADRFPQVADFRTALADLADAVPAPARPRGAPIVGYLHWTDPEQWASSLETWRTEERWDTLLTLLRERSRVEIDPPHRIDALVRAATVAEVGVGNWSLAASLWEQVPALDPNNERAWDRLEQTLRRMDRAPLLVEMLERFLVAPALAPAQRPSLHRRLARLHASEGGSRAAAARHWRAVLAHEPEDSEAAAALVDIYHGTPHLPGALETLEHLWGLQLTGETWIRLAEALGVLRSTQHYAPTAAAAVWARLLERDPDNAVALEYKARTLRLAADWQGYVTLARQRLTAVKDLSARSRRRLELAHILTTELHDTPGGIALLRETLAEQPGDLRTLRTLRSLLAAQGDAAAEIETLRELVAAASGRERIEARLRLAELLSSTEESADDALSLLERAVAEEPTEPRTRFAFEEMARGAGRLDRFCDAVLEHHTRLDEAGASEWLRRAMLAAWSPLEDHDRLGRLAQAALALDPANRLATLLRVEVASASEDWEGAIAALHEAVGHVADPAAAAEVHLQVARLAESRLQDPGRAAKEIERALEIAPAHPAALRALVRLYGDTRQWSEQAAVLERLEGRYPDGEAERLTILGQVHFRGLDDRARAIDTLRRALVTDPSHRRALELLEVAYREEGDLGGRASILHRLSELELPDEDRKRALEELAELRLRLGEPRGAAEALGRLLAMDPSREDLLARLESLDADSADLDTRLAVRRALVEQSRTDAERAAALLELADLLCEGAGGHEAAEAAADEARSLGADPADLERRRVRWYRGAGRHDQEGEALEALLAAGVTSEERAAALVRQAELADAREAESAEVRALLSEALEADPGCDAAYEALLRLPPAPVAAERIAPSVILGRWAEATREPSKRAEAQRRKAVLALDEGRPDEALAALEAAVAAYPDLEAVDRLFELRWGQGDWSGAEAVLGRRAEAMGDGASNEQWAAHHRLEGRVALRRGAFAAAAAAFEAAVRRDPTDLRSRLAQAAALRDAGEADVARPLYEELANAEATQVPADVRADASEALLALTLARQRDVSLEQLEARLREAPEDPTALKLASESYARDRRWKEAIEAARRLARVVTAADERADSLATLGMWLEDHGDDYAGAIEAYEEALRIDPARRPTRERLATLLLASEKGALGAEHLAALAESEANADEAARLHHRAGLTLWQSRGELRTAARQLELALDRAPHRTAAFEDLERLLRDEARHAELADACERMLERLGEEGDPALRWRLSFALGQLYADHLDAPEAALPWLERAIALDPDDLAARRLLVRLTAGATSTRARAVTEQRGIIRRTPRSVADHRELHRLLAETGDVDGAWCAAGVLAALAEACEEEREFYASRRRATLKIEGAPLALGEWPGLLFGAGFDDTLGTLLATLEPIASELPDGPKRSRDGHYEEVPSELAELCGATAAALGVPLAPTVRGAGDTGLRIVGTDPVRLVAGDDILTRSADPALRFAAGKAVAYMHPWLRLTGGLPVRVVERMVESVVAAAAGERGSSREARAAAKVLRKRLDPSQRRTVERLAADLTAGPSLTTRLREWVGDVERVTNHAGLLLADDIEAGVLGLRQALWSHQRLGFDLQLDDLLAFAVSADHTRLRKRLGIHHRDPGSV